MVHRHCYSCVAYLKISIIYTYVKYVYIIEGVYNCYTDRKVYACEEMHVSINE